MRPVISDGCNDDPVKDAMDAYSASMRPVISDGCNYPP